MLSLKELFAASNAASNAATYFAQCITWNMFVTKYKANKQTYLACLDKGSLCCPGWHGSPICADTAHLQLQPPLDSAGRFTGPTHARGCTWQLYQVVMYELSESLCLCCQYQGKHGAPPTDHSDNCFPSTPWCALVTVQTRLQRVRTGHT